MTARHLYLCQHGEALAKDVDPDRPLSEQGTTDVCNIANALGGRIEAGAVLHSGKTRARQTAELLHERLAPEAPLRTEEGLGPKDSPAAFASRLTLLDDRLMVIGHMPFVGALAAHLLGVTGRVVVEFQPGAILALAQSEEENWTISWMLTPQLVSG